MYCSNCGAPLKETDAKCSYCGTLNPVGAEAEYMEKLEDIREDTEDLGDQPPVEYTKHLKHQSLFALKLAGIVFAVILILFGIVQGVTAYHHHTDRIAQAKRIAFEQKYFPKLNELYASGDDAKVSAYMDGLYDEEGSDALFNWNHSTYYTYYEEYQWITEFRQLYQSKETYSDSDLIGCIYSSLRFFKEGVWTYDQEMMSADELEKVNTFLKEGESFLTEDLGLDLREIDDIYQSCQSDGFLDYNLLRDYLSEHKNLLQ